MRHLPSVLVVDDNRAALQTLTQLLSALGVDQVCQAASAEEALDILQFRHFTMILCDYRMEAMDGAEFVKQLRACGDNTPIMVLSGAPDKAGVIRATRYQGVDFFAKPFCIAELTGAMERLAA